MANISFSASPSNSGQPDRLVQLDEDLSRQGIVKVEEEGQAGSQARRNEQGCVLLKLPFAISKLRIY